MANLYEIDQAIMNCLDEETSEVLDLDRMNALQMERKAKIENVALLYKNVKADMEAYKAEKTAFAEKEQAAKNKLESLKNYLDYALQGQKFKSVRASIFYRKFEAVECDDVHQLDDDYLRYAEPMPDKIKIKDAIKAGQEVKGARLVERQSIQIQ